MEIKGQHDDDADIKAKAARRWVQAVNRTGEYGRWEYVVIDDPTKLGAVLDGLADASWDQSTIELSG